MADLLATTEDLASSLQQDVDTATATLLLEGATAIVQAATGQRIVQVVDDEVIIDIDQDYVSRWLDLPQLPVTEVSSVAVGGTTVTDFTTQLSRGRIWRSMGWRAAVTPDYDAPSLVTVVYSHGLADGDQRLQYARQAVLTLVGSLYSNPAGVTREQIDDYSVAYEAMSARMDTSPALRASLRRYYGKPRRSAQLATY